MGKGIRGENWGMGISGRHDNGGGISMGMGGGSGVGSRRNSSETLKMTDRNVTGMDRHLGKRVDQFY